MSESTKTPRKNSIIVQEFVSGRIVHTSPYIPGWKRTFDPRLATQANRAQAEIYGWKQRFADGHSQETVEVHGSREAAARAKAAWIDKAAAHYESSAETWELPREAAESGAQFRADVLEALKRFGAEEPEKLLAASAAKWNLEESGAAKRWAETKDIARHMADIKAERLAERANAKVGNAADLLAEFNLE